MYENKKQIPRHNQQEDNASGNRDHLSLCQPQRRGTEEETQVCAARFRSHQTGDFQPLIALLLPNADGKVQGRRRDNDQRGIPSLVLLLRLPAWLQPT